MKSFSLFLALRYLKPRRTFVSVITLISVLGVTLGITVLVLTISVMTGFDQEMKRKVVGFDAHLVIKNYGLIEDWREVAAQVKAASPEVLALSPTVFGPVIVDFRDQRMAPKIRGVDGKLEAQVTDIKNSIIAGEFNLDGPNTVLGAELARTLGATVGDKITIYSPSNLKEIIDQLDTSEKSGDKASKDQTLSKVRQLILPTEVTVTGIFSTGRFPYDSEILFVPLYLGQELYGLRDSVHFLAARTKDAYHAEAVKAVLAEKLPEPLFALTWMDLNRTLFDAVRLERTVMFFLLFFIVVVAAFGIMNTLITVTVQKRREIGILKALGARTKQVIWVFLAQGMVVGFFGNIIGLSLGLFLVHFRNPFSRWLTQHLWHRDFPGERLSVHGHPGGTPGQ